MSKRSAKELDHDYKPPEVPKAKKARNSKQKAFTKNSSTGSSLLDDNHNLIIQMHQNGTKPKDIAKAVLSTKGLTSGISGKQISDFLYYRKKSGQLKTFPVSGKNNNIRADMSDTCMFYTRCQSTYLLI